MITKYRLFENIEKAKKILKEKDISLSDSDFIKLKELLKNNTGYLGQFTKWMFIDGEKFSKIEEIFNMLLNSTINKDINSFDKLEDLYDYIQSYNINKKVNQVINSLPSETRKIVVDYDLKNLISMNIEYADLIKDFYSKKGGKYKYKNTLYDDTKQLIENIKGKFNLETIKEKLTHTSNTKIVYESEDLLIVKVYDYFHLIELDLNIGVYQHQKICGINIQQIN